MSKKTISIQSIALCFLENKNNKTFTELINRLKPGLTSFAYNFVKDSDLAKEVVSQTFIVIWEKIDQYNSKYNFSTWVYAIAKNEALGIIRNRNKNVSFDRYMHNHSRLLQLYNPVFNMNTEVLGATGEDLTQRLFDASLSAIDQLQEPYKTVMIEREINQKQLNDIAEDLGWNLSTVKTRLRKARKDVAQVLYKKYPDEVDSYFGNEDEE
jgi:RNA polymerase sigma-70 factor (ECF subfamily)